MSLDRGPRLSFLHVVVDKRRYNLTGWAIKLNEITLGLEQKLAPTDCRLRPDQHATEAGDYDEVGALVSVCTFTK